MFPPLSELVSRAPLTASIHLLYSCFRFPATETIRGPTAAFHLQQERLDIGALIKEVQTHQVPDLALTARDDVVASLQMMTKVREELRLDSFDCIQIHRGGLDMVSVTITSNKCGRSLVFEINDYRQGLLNAIEPQDRTILYTAVLSSMVGAAIVGVSFWAWDRSKMA